MKEIKLINQPAMQEHVSQEISRLEWFLLLQQEEKMKKDKKKKL
jgi:hypothetical protein